MVSLELFSRCPIWDTWDSGTSWDSIEFLEQAADHGFAEAQFDGNLANRSSCGFQCGHLLLSLLPILERESSQVFVFMGIANKSEMKKTIGLDDLVKENVISKGERYLRRTGSRKTGP